MGKGGLVGNRVGVCMWEVEDVQGGGGVILGEDGGWGELSLLVLWLLLLMGEL